MNFELLNTAKASHVVYAGKGLKVEILPNKPTRVSMPPAEAVNLKRLQGRGSPLQIRGLDESAEILLSNLPPLPPRSSGPRKFQPRSDSLAAALAVAKTPEKIEVKDELAEEVAEVLLPSPPARSRRTRKRKTEE